MILNINIILILIFNIYSDLLFIYFGEINKNFLNFFFPILLSLKKNYKKKNKIKSELSVNLLPSLNN